MALTYATTADILDRTTRTFSPAETAQMTALLEDAAVMIDAAAPNAPEAAKKVVSCRMVIRAMGDGTMTAPIGATQGAMTAGPYTQSWTISSGLAVGELYLGKAERRLLGLGDNIGAGNPLESLVRACVPEEGNDTRETTESDTDDSTGPDDENTTEPEQTGNETEVTGE